MTQPSIGANPGWPKFPKIFESITFHWKQRN